MTTGNEIVPLEDIPNDQDGTDNRDGMAGTIDDNRDGMAGTIDDNRNGMDEIDIIVNPAARPTTLNMRNNSDEIDFRSVDRGLDEPDAPNNNGSSKNVFTDRQNIVRGLCDASLMAANISQLRAVLDGDPGNKYFIPLLIMIGLSLFSHITFGLLMIQRWRKERKAELEHQRDVEKAVGTPVSRASNPRGVTCLCAWCGKVEWYDEVSMYCMYFVIILNVAIAGLGLTDNNK
ncbi:ninjurin-A isoform X2 [Magallana gigas]|uniref:ninjurin-A isoform X2 n=1 Tax=Magallana gigas TaxID=29159 RepID=UPI003341A6C4